MTIKKWAFAVAALAAVAGIGVVLASRIANAEARARIDAIIAALPPAIGAHYAAVSYSLFTGKLTIAGITLTNTQRGRILVETIDKVEIAHPSRSLADAWARISTDPTALTRETILPIANHIAVSGIVSTLEGVRASLAHLAVDGVRLRPWSLFQPGVPSLAETVALLTPPNNLAGGNPPALWAAAGTLARGLAAGLLALDYDDATESGFVETADLPASTRAPAKHLTITVDEVRLAGGLHRGVVGPVEDIDFRQSTGTGNVFHAARARFAGLDFQRPAEQLVAGAPLSISLLDGLKIGDFSIEGFSAVEPTSGTIAIDRIGMDNIAFADGFPRSAHLAIDQLRVTAALLDHTPASADTMRMLGLKTLTVSAGLGYLWDPDQQTIALDRTSLKIAELGTATLDAQVGGIAPGLPPRALADRATLTSVKLQYTDGSLMNRLLTAAAARSQIDVETMRQRLMTAIPERASILGQSPAAGALIAALTRFVAAPKSLTLAAVPPQPVPLYQLVALRQADPTTLVGLFGLTATANVP